METTPPVLQRTYLHIGEDQTVVSIENPDVEDTRLVLPLGSVKTGSAYFKHAPPTAAEIEQAIDVVPGDGAFDHPACHAEMAAMPSTALADLRADATSSQDTAITFAVVGAVGLDTFRSRNSRIFIYTASATERNFSHRSQSR